MSAECSQYSFDHINFSIDPEVEKKARELLGNVEDTAKMREASKRWIHSPVKAALERVSFGLMGSIVALPTVLVARGGVLVVDGTDTLYHLDVGFFGKDGETVSPTRITKVRSFKKDVDKKDAKQPLKATAFIGGRDREALIRDPRVHSDFGMWIRRSGVDEFPQVTKQVLKGEMAGVGARAYTHTELEGLKIIYELHDGSQDVFPDTFPHDYREVMSEVQPKPGFLGLYTAILRKRLTISERLLLDYLYATLANPIGDFRIIKASMETILKRTGAS